MSVVTIRTMFLIGLAAFGGITSAQAGVMKFEFDCITNNNAANCAAGENQLRLTTTQEDKYIDFRFANIGSVVSSITDIYFDWPDRRRYGDKYEIEYEKGKITESPYGVSFFIWRQPEESAGGQFDWIQGGPWRRIREARGENGRQ